MNTVHPTRVIGPVHPFWVTAAASVAVVLVAGLAIVGGSGLLNQRAGTLPVASSNAPSFTPSAAPTAPLVIPSGDPIAVTGSLAGDAGRMCSPSWCQFAFGTSASDSRLTGPFVLEASGGTAAGTFGTVVFFEPGTAGGGYYRISMMPANKLTWEGEWFSAGPRPVGIGFDTNAVEVEQSSIWPVDTIWLHGRNANAGLTAVLRAADDGSMTGWIFATPTSH